jgi:hypothetical protein
MKRIFKLSVLLLSIGLFVFNFYATNNKHANDQQLGVFIQAANAGGEGNCATMSWCHSDPGRHCVGNDGGTVFDCEDKYSS